MDLHELRRRFTISLKGAGLPQLIEHAAALGLVCRPLRVELDEVVRLKMPCILHWDLNHFVVLARHSRGRFIVLDPAKGERRMLLNELSPHFTGVAVEIDAGAAFRSAKSPPTLKLSELAGNVSGLGRGLAQIFAVSAVLELFGIAAPMFSQAVIDDVLISGDRDLLAALVVGFALLLGMQTALGFARSWMVMVLGQSLALQWAGNVFAHMVRLPVGYFERRHLGEIVSRFGAVGAIQRTLTTAAVESMLDGIMAVAALTMMLLYSGKLAALSLVSVLLYTMLRWYAYRPLRDAAAERLVVSAKENSHFLETLRAITALKLFGHEHERRARWQNLVVDVQNRDVRTAKLNITFRMASAFIFGFENLLVFWLGATLVMSGQTNGMPTLTIGMLFAYVAYKNQFTTRVSGLIGYAIELKMLALHGQRLADIVLEDPEAPSSAESRLDHLPPTLELRGVSFRYGDGEPWTLHNVNLCIAAGESVAITGASGCGKTTLLKILFGLLEPNEGEVLYGGVPLCQLGLGNVRRRIGTVMQDDALLSGSLAENIAFFALEPDMQRVEACARLAHVHDEIVHMPMGYRTIVGDLGSGLSGGQKQRLLLARAMYKQPSVLALDEATSHLDVGTERALAQSLGRLSLTRLIIAHRPETIAGAQRVVQLREGRVVELMRALEAAGLPSASDDASAVR